MYMYDIQSLERMQLLSMFYIILHVLCYMYKVMMAVQVARL